jgi:hypothetical protein
MTAPERPGPERPGPDYPPEWDCEPAYEWHPCPDCGFQCASHEWACWRCGAVQEDD